jgi:hypothetical protein
VLTAILYLNPGWTAADGGQLRLYPHQRSTHYDVEPIGKGRRTSLMRVLSLLGVGCHVYPLQQIASCCFGPTSDARTKSWPLTPTVTPSRSGT